MLRLLIVSGALASFLSFGATVRAQETPAPTPRCPAAATASISGRVELVGPEPYGGYITSVAWLPADVPQPIQIGFYFGNSVAAGSEGRYVIPCLDEGAYFVLIGRNTHFVVEPPDTVRVRFGEETASLQARRVFVGEGEAITGIDFSITFPTPGPIIDHFPTWTPTPVQHTEGPQPYDDMSLPPTGGEAGQALHAQQVILVTALLCGLGLAASLAGLGLRRRGPR